MEQDGAEASLAAVCSELNFRHSLAQDAWELRTDVVAALTRSADALEDLAAALRIRAGLRRAGADRDQLLAVASRMDERAAATRDRCADLAARPLDPPRPPAPLDPDAVSS
jgi:hypothetical protein